MCFHLLLWRGLYDTPRKVIWIVLKIPTEIEKIKKPHKVTENP